MENTQKLGYLQFSEYCEKIKEILKLNFKYEERKYFREESDNEYKRRDLSELPQKLFLSNGDCLHYMIPKYAIPHLLGINTDFLINNGFVKATNAYDALIEIIETPDRLKNKFKIDDYSKVVSPYIERKLESFVDNVLIDINNCVFVCKFDVNRSYGYNNNEDMDYFILTEVRSNDNKHRYDILILKEAEDRINGNKYYVPQSNQSFNSKEELIEKLSDKLFNQELTLLISKLFKVRKYENYKNHWLKNRKEKLTDLEDWCNEFDCIPNVLHDFLYSLKLLNIEKTKTGDTNTYIDSIVKDIKKGNFIRIQYKLLSQEMVEFLEAYNDFVSTSDSANNKENEETYTKLLKRKNDLEEMLKEVSIAKEAANTKLEEITQKYEDAVKENELLKESMKKIHQLSIPSNE